MLIKQLLLTGILVAMSGSAWGAPMLQPYPAPVSGVRLTPAVSPSPSINGAKVYGVHPGSDIIFKVATSGDRPMKFSAKGLPSGVKLDPKTGIFSGKITVPGDYPIQVLAKNAHGQAKDTIILRVGKTLILTPPMGWNSWYSFNEALSQDGVLKTARLMEETGLGDHGWSYINMDDCWQGERGGPLKAIQPNERFRDMKAMCDEVHSRGFKIGLYSGPWVSTYAGFAGGSCDNPEGDYNPGAIPLKERKQPGQYYGSWPGLHNRKMDHIGKYWFFDKDAKQWAQWGFDYVKVDWLPNDVPTTERIFKDLQNSGRSIALSLSNAAPYENMDGLSKYANVTRTTGDIHDSWGSIKGIGFSQERWQKYTRPGCWCDPDMLQVGHLGKTGQANTTFTPTRLTPDEQYTQVSLWSLLSAPLLMSCDLEALKSDPFTLGLLCNDDIISVNQDPAGNPAKRVMDKDGIQVWTKELKDGSIAVGFFNLNDDKKEASIRADEMNLKGRLNARDLWKRKEAGTVKDTVRVELNPHGATMMRFSKK